MKFDLGNTEQLAKIMIAAGRAGKDGEHVYSDARDSNLWKENTEWQRVASPELFDALIERLANLEAKTVHKMTVTDSKNEKVCTLYGSKEDVKEAVQLLLEEYRRLEKFINWYLCEDHRVPEHAHFTTRGHILNWLDDKSNS